MTNISTALPQGEGKNSEPSKGNMNKYRIFYSIPLLCLLSCANDNNIYTLYRSSVTADNMRIHVATFDAYEDEEYNLGNCNIAKELFVKQDGVKVEYWCEKGRFEK
jgi:hypothetical protein